MEAAGMLVGRGGEKASEDDEKGGRKTAETTDRNWGCQEEDSENKELAEVRKTQEEKVMEQSN